MFPAPITALRRPHARRGMSLLEVMLALSIFLLSMIAIGQLLVRTGDVALEVKLQSQAVQMAQGKLAEVVAGVQAMSAQGDMPFDDDPAWQWGLEVQSQGVQGLSQVTVRVSRPCADGSKLQYSLCQFVLDPSLRGSTLATPPGPAVSASAGAGGAAGGANAGGAGAAGAAGAPAKGGAPGKGGAPAPAPAPKGGAAPPPAGKKG